MRKKNSNRTNAAGPAKADKPNISDKNNGRKFALHGLFFGVGFTLGFLICFGFLRAKVNAELLMYSNAMPASERELAPASSSLPEGGKDNLSMAVSALSQDSSPPPSGPSGTDTETTAMPTRDIDLVLSEHELGEDENGIFISGTVLNDSVHAFDAIRVAFDLCDRSGEPYSSVSDWSNEHMEPGDVWGFTIYIPYTDMDKFSSYKLQSIMGVTN
ncbi:MAG: FxLYD domain-containing protein [Synergistaceae bacterium]|nr:FxLYD domain-containing protein [Synergistaceae bacterium]